MITIPSSKRLVIFLHLFGWALFFVFPLLMNSIDTHYPQTHKVGVHAISPFILFYLNYFIFVPKLLFKKKHLLFFLLVITGILLTYLINEAVFKIWEPEFQHFREELDRLVPKFPENIMREPQGINFRLLFSTISMGLIVTGISTSLRFYEKLKKNEKKQSDITNQQLNTELAFLKNQINPHFLFNSLNSIYALAYRKSDNTTEAIIKLSHILRYAIYDSKDDLVPLPKDIEHIQSYIELQKLRISETTTINLLINGILEGHKIEPMLLISFIENAFKYGVDNVSQTSIDIEIKVENDRMYFKTTNAIFENHSTSFNQKEKGLGIQNTIRRLELLYPNQHKLKISNQNKIFIVELELNLK